MATDHPIQLVPAIDLHRGRVVRLLHGDPNAETQYDDDPVARAKSFVAMGATRLHVVDLDGAFGEQTDNMQALRAICSAVSVPVQTGGGVRSLEQAKVRFGAGAAAVIIGTILVEDPNGARKIVEQYGSAVIAGIDARGSQVAVRGWKEPTSTDRDDLVRTVYAWGLERVVYTEISRDGAGGGYDVEALAHVARLTPMQITASGGASSTSDLRRLREETPPNVDAAILGRALYEGTIDLLRAIPEFA